MQSEDKKHHPCVTSEVKYVEISPSKKGLYDINLIAIVKKFFAENVVITFVRLLDKQSKRLTSQI